MSEAAAGIVIAGSSSLPSIFTPRPEARKRLRDFFSSHIPQPQHATRLYGGSTPVRGLLCRAWVSRSSEEIKNRVRFAYEIVCRAAGDSIRVVLAWLTGINPELGNQVPLRMLHDDDLEILGPRIRGASSAFVVGS